MGEGSSGDSTWIFNFMMISFLNRRCFLPPNPLTYIVIPNFSTTRIKFSP
jgi:hypothetical protein